MSDITRPGAVERGTATRGTGAAEEAADAELDAAIQEQVRRRRAGARLVERREIEADLARARATPGRLQGPAREDDVVVRPAAGDPFGIEAPPGFRVDDATRWGPRGPTADPPFRFAVPPVPTLPAGAPARRAAAPAPPERYDLRELWRAQAATDPPPTTLSEEEWNRLRRLDALIAGGVSIDTAIRVASRITLEGLRANGFPLAEEEGRGPLSELLDAIVYVGPGFGMFVTPAGSLLQTPVGYSFYAPGVDDPGGKQTGGMFVAGRNTLIPVSLTGSREARYGPPRDGRLGVMVEDRWALREDLYRWSATTDLMLFAVSPSFWRRYGPIDAYAGGFSRLRRAVSRSINRGYVRDAAGEAFNKMDPYEIAKGALLALAELLSPVPIGDRRDDFRRQGIAVGMAIWGRGNEEGDIDAAARILAPEIVSLVLEVAVQGVVRARNIVRKASRRAVPAPPVDAPAAQVKGKRAPPAPPADPRSRADRAIARPEQETAQGGAESPRRATEEKATADRRADATARTQRTPKDLEVEIGTKRFARLRAAARRHLAAYLDPDPKTRAGALGSLKGVVLEATIEDIPEVGAAIARAKRVAHLVGVDPDTVERLAAVTDVEGGLTDGIIVGRRGRGKARPNVRSDEVADPELDEIVVFSIIEAKVIGKARKLVQEPGRGAPPELGQFEKSRGRMETGIVTVDGVDYPATNVFVPADLGYRLQIVVIVPKDLSPTRARNLLEDVGSQPVTQPGRRRDVVTTGQGRDVVIGRSSLTDAECGAIARTMLEELAAGR